MRCERVQFLYSEYVAGTLAPQTMAAIEEHLAACPECHKFFEDSDRIGQMIRSQGQVGHPGQVYFDDLAARVLNELDNAPPQPNIARRILRVRPIWWAGAAAALILISLALAPELMREPEKRVAEAKPAATAPTPTTPAANAPSGGTVLVKGVSNPAEPTTILDEILPSPLGTDRFNPAPTRLTELQASRGTEMKMANANTDRRSPPLDTILEQYIGGSGDLRRGLVELEFAAREQLKDPAELVNHPLYKQAKYYLQGEDELTAGHPDEALRLFQRVLLVNGSSPIAMRANLQMADLLFSEQANFKQALAFYRKCRGAKGLSSAERLRVQRQIELLQQYRADDWQALAHLHSLKHDPWPEAMAALRDLAANEKSQTLLPESARAVVDRFGAADKPSSGQVMEIYSLLAEKARTQPGGESRAYLELYLGELAVHLAQPQLAVEHFTRATAAAEGSVAAGIAAGKIKQLEDQRLNYRVRNGN